MFIQFVNINDVAHNAHINRSCKILNPIDQTESSVELFFPTSHHLCVNPVVTRPGMSTFSNDVLHDEGFTARGAPCTIQRVSCDVISSHFASHHTRNRHVGFLFSWHGIGKHNKMSNACFFFI